MPLGMAHSTASITDVPPSGDVIAYHAKVNGRLSIVAADSSVSMNPAGGICSTVSDLARWMIVQLDSGRSGQRRLWSAERTREMWTPETLIPITQQTGDLSPLTTPFYAYALGWRISSYRGHPLVFHSGAIDGVSSRIVLIPDLKVGVTVLANEESALPVAIAWRLVDASLGAPPTDWATAIDAEVEQEEAQAAATVRAEEQARTSASSSEVPTARLVGRYVDQMYGEATVSANNGHVVLAFSHSPIMVADLDGWQYDTFVAHWRSPIVPDAFVTFAFTPLGSVASMTLAPVSPLADFSFDYRDLLFRPVKTP
jgi:CubicO group peptidase (beta-lactamase class C family)